MNLSYWEQKHFFSNIDYCIAGGGIVGLSTALQLRDRYPEARILILEKSLIGAAASSRNAGFACFGSISEILDDVKNFGAQAAGDLVRMRWKGLKLLRKTLGDKRLGLNIHGGYELFTKNDRDRFEECRENIAPLNTSLRYIGKRVFSVMRKDPFEFRNVVGVIRNAYEGQLDTGAMYFGMEQKCLRSNILIIRGLNIDDYSERHAGVTISIGNDMELKARHLLITTNGFAARLIPGLDVEPARAQVLVTQPIPNLKLKGTFHYDRGYSYFRNIGDRVLIGGGRNLDLLAERTDSQETTDLVQQHIENLLFKVILGKRVKIERRWAGTMGVGPAKLPIIRSLSPHVHCGVRMGGMGIAIGSLVGRQLSDLVD